MNSRSICGSNRRLSLTMEQEKFLGEFTLDLISRILSKVVREKTTMTLLIPFWESAPWFPMLLDLLIAPPIQISTDHIIYLTNFQQPYPLRNPHWSLLACRISGYGMKQKVFQRK